MLNTINQNYHIAINGQINVSNCTNGDRMI